MRFLVLFLLLTQACFGQGFLKADGAQIVDGSDKPVILRGMGLGGWMLQEGYMFQLSALGQQYRIREKIAATAGEAYAEYFYKEWLRRHVREADIRYMKQAGFNSIRLPMHYQLYTAMHGNVGFALTDSLLKWCARHQMYLILDMHAAPGGQGHDLPISDRDPSSPSLWQSPSNQQEFINIWVALAKRYANEPWIGGYDLLNEPNWSFTSKEEERGISETDNTALRTLYMKLTAAIRKVDKRHLLIIEGNGFGNNYRKVLPPWDSNMALSFHKYGNYNNIESIQGFLDLRKQYNIPIWLGESGENSNTWFTEAIKLAESNGIGWAWWQEKKMGINQPREIKIPKDYDKLVSMWTGKGAALDSLAVRGILNQLLDNILFENTIDHPDVVDAMFRQVQTHAALPFWQRKARTGLIIPAVDYDLGAQGVAYYDADSARYQYTPGNKSQGNKGWTYRNDGVDISQNSEGFFVFDFQPDEWLQYTLNADKRGTAQVMLRLRADKPCEFDIVVGDLVRRVSYAGGSSTEWTAPVALPLSSGANNLRIRYVSGNAHLYSLSLKTYETN